jgi:adenylate cyclase class 1
VTMGPLKVSLIHRNKKCFQNYNRLRYQLAYDLNAEKASVAFEIIPVLLTLNEVDLPGYVQGGEVACGVYGIGSSYHLRRVIQDYFPEARRRQIPYQRYLIKRPMVESLFLLGSIGTIAQTDGSDFDFWVCVDGARFSPRQFEKLYEKTQLIAQWCKSTFSMDVHFFILELEKIRANDFGKVDAECAGSSQKEFLKEECYRTMLLVSGKIPFWWVVPSGASRQTYEESWDWMAKEAPLDFLDFVDLGYLTDIPKTEFMGNALWQLSKGIKDPFKALLKMGMMEVYLSDSFEGPLFCDVLKERVLSGCNHLQDLDPYLLMFEKVLRFYGTWSSPHYRALMQRAFYLKADPKITRTKVKTSGGDYKVEVFRGLMEDWVWSLDHVEDLNQVANWSYGRQSQFSAEINQYFFSTYRALSETLQLTEKQAIEDDDLTILGRKLLVLFGRRRNKLKLTPFLSSKRLILGRCIFQYEAEKTRKKRWVIHDASWYPAEQGKKRTRIFSAESVVRAAAWLVYNGLYDFHRTAIEMLPNASGVRMSDLEHLLKHLESFFQPAIYECAEGVQLGREVLRDRILVTIDMEEMTKLKGPRTLDLVYKNTWGEMFTETYPFEQGMNVLKGYAEELYRSDLPGAEGAIRIHIPSSAQDTDLAPTIYLTLRQDLGLENPVETLHYRSSLSSAALGVMT